jgi:hypothetical protein
MMKEDYKYIKYNSQYENEYNMNYIFNNDVIIYDNAILNMKNMNEKYLNYTNVIELIKYHFLSMNMVKYFGNMRDLNCKQTRDLYKFLIVYFTNLFLGRMKIMTNIDVMKIDDENDPYVCFIAECMNIIRASVKKYVRLRTSASQPKKCQREELENRNRKKYECAVPMREYEYCPSFHYLKQKGKTCKNILESSMTTNEKYNIFAELFKSSITNNNPITNNNSININKNIVKSIPKTRRETRKVRQTNRSPQINMPNQNMNRSDVKSNPKTRSKTQKVRHTIPLKYSLV